MTPAPSAPALYRCEIRHVRTGPRRYAFGQRTYLWLVDLDHIPVLPRALRPLARFDARDHFAGTAAPGEAPGPALRAGLDRYLAAHGIDLAGGRVLMLAHARVLGHVFNPLTLYWCHGPATATDGDSDSGTDSGGTGDLRCVVAEVHNTYGERHCYLLRPEAADGRAETPKEFYVSPFFTVDGTYRMRLPEPGARLDLAVHLDREGVRRFTATVRGTRGPATARALLRAAARRPFSTLAVSLGIRLHGIRLWARGLPVVPRPRHRPQEGLE
ncbi:DUF1365 domain-containing protein [Streptomyces albidoflavus]|uniref:DUF1365 domain-containing protein n=1 Tax=Streptomyces albidoflavus TaxID=1886 RepID=A0AA37BYR3_9ACTN|nr:DUF1365 domain-containing protein [Streptomyces albidoflavus]RZE56893.1 DUF1365 domain-containing protein [Streptomyces albidoflavus]WQG72246.1 DUF1365 domain-containing protein [Streptomyces albidoflavus]GHI46749.1 DUF1365 domain-containing protein [Streptomyces albidoflavus]